MKGNRFSLIGHVSQEFLEPVGEQPIDAGDRTRQTDQTGLIPAMSLQRGSVSDPIDECKGFPGERDQPFGVHLSQGDLEIFFIMAIGDDAVLREVDELADSHSCLSEKEEERGVRIVRLTQDFLKETIVLRGERPGQIFGDLGEMLPVQDLQEILFQESAIDLPGEILFDGEKVSDPAVRDQILAVEIGKIISQERFGEFFQFFPERDFSRDLLKPIAEVGEVHTVAGNRGGFAAGLLLSQVVTYPFREFLLHRF